MYAVSFIEKITAFRNPNGSEFEWTKLGDRRVPANPWKVALAEIGYVAVIPFAVVETAFGAIAALFLSGYFYLTDNQPCLRMVMWPFTSAFAVGWSFVNALINPFCNDMIEKQENAWATACSGNIFRVRFQTYNGIECRR
jgi:hypothetical protein